MLSRTGDGYLQFVIGPILAARQVAIAPDVTERLRNAAVAIANEDCD